MFVGYRHKARDWLLYTRIAFKIKMTKVSNPAERKQKRKGTSLNSSDLENKAMAAPK